MIDHKAIDLTVSPKESLRNLLKLNNINGVLTSGGCKSARLGVSTLKQMISLSPKDFEIIAAGKITNNNLKFLHDEIGAKFYHGKKIIGEL